jgi:hypothetical protein
MPPVKPSSSLNETANMKTGILNVDGVEYRWQVYRQPRWTSARSLLGMAILVEPPTQSRRELLLEFDIDPSRHGDMPQHQRFRVTDRRLIECIENAIKAGWDPTSRGKRFVYDAGPVKLAKELSPLITRRA